MSKMKSNKTAANRNEKESDESVVLLTEAEASKKLTIGQSTLQRIRLSGEIEFYRIGNQVRYSPDQITAYLTNAKEIFERGS